MEINQLDNGLRWVYFPYSNLQVSYCSLIIDVGSSNESIEELGMAHFMEHMMFKGTQKRKGIQIISELDNVGGELNAFTTKEKTCIHASFGSNYIKNTIDLICDIAMFSQFPEKEIEKEKQIVHDEINMYLDNPEESIYDDFLEKIYPNHPLGRSILGTHNDVDKFSKERLLNFVKNHYSTDKMVFTIFTSLDFKLIEKLLVQATANYPILKNKSIDQIKPTKYKKFISQKESDFVQTHCVLGSNVCSVKDNEKFALAMLNNILGGPFMNSRLNLAIREKYGFCYNIYSDVQLFKNSGVFTVNFATEKKYINKCKELVNIELNKLCNKNITSTQFKTALKQVSGQLQLSWDNPSGMVTTLGNALLDNNKILTADEVFQKFNQLTPEYLNEIANKYLKSDRQSEYIYMPQKN